MKRVLCIWLPNWPLERLYTEQPELKAQRVVLHQPAGCARPSVIASSPAAQRQGVLAGMPLAEALALVSENRRVGQPQEARGWWWMPHDRERDRQALEQLAQWCQRYSPLVSLEEGDAPQSLLIEIGGSSRSWGGELRLVRDATLALRRRKITARLAVADSLGAAWAMAHFSPAAAQKGWCLVPAGQTMQWLGPLPLEALRLPPTCVPLLAELGLTRIDQLGLVSRAGLAGRLGPEIAGRLDQALGCLSEVLPAEAAIEPLEVEWPLEMPTTDPQTLRAILASLVAQITRELARRQQAAEHVLCQLECPFDHLAMSAQRRVAVARERAAAKRQSEGRPGAREGLYVADREIDSDHDDEQGDGVTGSSHEASPQPQPGNAVMQLRARKVVVEVALPLFRPTASPRLLGELIELEWEHLKLPGPVEKVRIAVPSVVPLEFRQQSLFDDPATIDRERHLAALWSRLAGRLGREAVVRPRTVSQAQPERACRYEPLVASSSTRRGSAQRRRAPPKARRKSSDATDRSAIAGDKHSEQAITPAQAVAQHWRPLNLAARPQPVRVLAVAPDGPPVRVRCGRQQYTLRCVWGPERIETGWWRGRMIVRDYYQVETSEGARGWLFRRLSDGRWFWQGWFE